ncbi:uncharacterized protein LOC100830221 [Brachypodium distachyon]|uniref:Uncharacterized protein n=1 Tax=Brachypodium distachyon TaxID=15368 RepID=I1I8T3_BRADI|nr:uncharacterized protein LOC100830221 [Brachypodium distachyon]KQJ99077.1 hypothetical protein BRADI_3g40900v3 [Brachypodium distachyon]|eukprot:XP_014756278.1 uncharacterized protein LOC100830221 [Brachypodium distachyon]
MESGGASFGGGGGGDGGGHLCHLCGYKYASAHPSAKQRRAHRKNCGKPPSATAAAGAEEEGADGRKSLLLPGERDGERGGEGSASGGGGLPGSAQDGGNVLQDEDNGDHSSPNGAGAQVSIDKSIEDCLISCNDIPSEVAPKANGTELQTEVARQLSENALHLEDFRPSQPDVSGDQQQDAFASHPPSEPEDGALEISADEISKPCVTVLTSNAASDDISAQTNAIVSCPDDTGITEKDFVIDTIGRDKTSEDLLVKDSEINSLYQDKPQIKIVEGQSATAPEEDLCVSNVSVVSQKEIPSEETESKEESGFITTNSIEPSTDKHVHTDDTSGDDLLELAAGGSHLEEGDVVKTQQQTDSTLVVADQLSNSKKTDLEGQRYPDADEVIQAVSSAIGPDVDAGVISAGSAADLTKKDPTESEIDLVELSSYPTSHVINVISSKHGVEDAQDNDMSADLTSHERPVEHSIDIDEATSHGANAVCSTGNFEGIKQIEEITAEDGLGKISVPQGTISVEEKELIEEVTPDPASVKTDVISSRDIVEEREEGEVYVGTAHEVNMANIPGNVELDKHSEETSKDPTACETNMTSITDNVEEKKQKEEITNTDHTLHAFNVICSPDNEVKKKNEDMTEGPSSHENALVDGTDNAKEKDEEAMSDPTPYKVDVVSTVDVAEEKKLKEEVVAEPTHEINVNDVIEKSEEPTVSLKIDAGSNADPILAADTSSHQSNIPQVTDNTEEKNQNEDVAADPTSDKIPEAQSIGGVEEQKQKEDQNEEITDKEMTINSDKSHVSLKSLLSEKGMEVKEKKASTKDRVLSFRRKSSKDNPSPAKAGSEQQDWNSPARLPAEKSPKGKKQQWMPFICCHSMN